MMRQDTESYQNALMAFWIVLATGIGGGVSLAAIILWILGVL